MFLPFFPFTILLHLFCCYFLLLLGPDNQFRKMSSCAKLSTSGFGPVWSKKSLFFFVFTLFSCFLTIAMLKIVKLETFLKINYFKVQGYVKLSGESENNGYKILQPRKTGPHGPEPAFLRFFVVRECC